MDKSISMSEVRLGPEIISTAEGRTPNELSSSRASKRLSLSLDKGINERAGDFSGVIKIARIKGYLATTGLSFRYVYGMP